MHRRGRHLCEPHSRGCDGRERPRALVRVRQSAQGRRPQCGADRRMPDQPQADPGEEEGRVAGPWLGAAVPRSSPLPHKGAGGRPRLPLMTNRRLWIARAGTLRGSPLRWRRANRGPPAMTIRPRRSVLYMPGSNARALEKARGLPADAVILDLEDAVAPNAKETARKQVTDAVKAGGF